MGQVRYSPSARADLEKIASEIIDNNGAIVAARVLRRMRRSLSNLGDYPEIGRKRPQLGRGVRSWPFRPWIAFYRRAGDDVEVIRVIHGKRRINRKLLLSVPD